MKYLSGGAFRRALEDRLRTISLQGGLPLVRLRKMVAFDRFLARLIQRQPDQWVVKGGLALQLRLGSHARTTKDVDMLILTPNQAIYPKLRSAVAMDLKDWFSFEVTQPNRQMPAGLGGERHQIQTLLDGRTFETFHVDVGIGDPMIEPVDYLMLTTLLAFADLVPTRVPCFPITQQIAEKLHAYTRPRMSGEPSRVKDLMDILLLAEFGKFNGERLLQAIRATFDFAKTHPIPPTVPPPPQDWTRAFEKLVGEVGFKGMTLNQAYIKIQQFLDPVLYEGITKQQWDPANWSWKWIS